MIEDDEMIDFDEHKLVNAITSVLIEELNYNRNINLYIINAKFDLNLK